MPAAVKEGRIEKRYIVFGGYLKDIEGRKYYVSPMEVMKKYGVNPVHCLIGDPDTKQQTSGLQHMRGLPKLIHLEPQQNPDNYKKVPE